MELVLIRHALPVRIDATPGGEPADPGLAERGVRQARRIPAALDGDKVTAIYSSPARRALETAEPLVAALGLELQIEPGVAEFDSADSSYVPVEELRANNDPRWHALVRGDLYSAGVDPVAFRARVVEALERIASRHPSGRAVVFTHSGSVNAYTGHVLAQDRPLWFAPAYGSITRVAVNRKGKHGMVSLNETGHVRDLL